MEGWIIWGVGLVAIFLFCWWVAGGIKAHLKAIDEEMDPLGILEMQREKLKAEKAKKKNAKKGKKND